MGIWVFSEQNDVVLELASEARRLAQQVTAIVTDSEIAQSVINAGADKVYVLPAVAGVPLETCAEDLAKLLKSEQAQLFLVGATRRGKEIAARIAALLDVGCISDCKGIRNTEGKYSFVRYMYGGLAEACLETDQALAILTIPPRTFEIMKDEVRIGQVSELAPYTSEQVRVLEVKEKSKTSVNIKEANIVVGVGRGFAKEEDLKLAYNLAETLGGEVGCTRPIAEDLHWLPEECYIGISGQVIKPSLYFAVGLSGQVQHTSGMRDAKVVFAINNNENAPIFQVADYYIQGDLYQVVPAILQKLQDK